MIMLYTLIITWKGDEQSGVDTSGTVLSVDATRPQAAEKFFLPCF